MAKLKLLERLDSWSNIITGLGQKNKDKRTRSIVSHCSLSQAEAEAAYAGDEMARKVVDKLPRDMLRQGFRLTSAELEEDTLEDVMSGFENLMITPRENKLLKGLKWGRMYGGAALVVGTDADRDDNLAEPLEDFREIRYLTLLSMHELQPEKLNGNPMSPNFNMPETYRIGADSTDTTSDQKNLEESEKFRSIEIHHTRIIRFEGLELPRQLFQRNNYWHDSLLGALLDDIRDWQNSHASSSVLILDFAQAIYKVKNLADIVSSEDGLKTIQERIGIIELGRSVIRASVIDADGEDFERKSTPLSGLPELLDRVNHKFTASTEYPHTVLLGDTPSGLGATGQAEQRVYDDVVAGAQEADLKPVLKEIFTLIMSAKSGPTGGNVPADFDFEFEPLSQQSKSEEIESRNKQAETDKLYIETGVLDPEEVANSRFSGGEYSFETEIDDNVRREIPTVSGVPTADADDTTHVHFIGDGVRDLTGSAIDAGNGLHFHDTPFGPTEPAADGEGHVHAIKASGGKKLETGTPFPMFTGARSDTYPGKKKRKKSRKFRGKRT